MNLDESLEDMNSKRSISQVHLTEREDSQESEIKKRIKVDSSPTPPLSQSEDENDQITSKPDSSPTLKKEDIEGEEKPTQISQNIEVEDDEEDQEENKVGEVIEEKKNLRSHSMALKNLQFYFNKMKSVPNGDFITNILREWKGKYKLLEDHHGYVQWLFPNFFQSRFNNGSLPLVKEEADIFISTRSIAIKLKLSYDLIYDFFGIELVNDQTGELRRSQNYLLRYHSTFVTSYHNHMRIRRILCNQNNCGFRKYAVQLVAFLEKEIYGPAGYNAFVADKRLLTQKLLDLSIETAPLKSLARLRVFQDWNIYGQIDETDQSQIELLQDNCFATWEDISRQSIYFDLNQRQS